MVQDDQTPPHVFGLEELQIFQDLRGGVLEGVVYYVWRHGPDRQFLYFIDLIFRDGPSLMLTSGEDSEAIRISDADALIKTAEALQTLHGEPIIHRIVTSPVSIWAEVLHQRLDDIRLSRDENGLYRNDVLALDFEGLSVLVHLREEGGLGVSRA